MSLIAFQTFSDSKAVMFCLAVLLSIFIHCVHLPELLSVKDQCTDVSGACIMKGLQAQD